MDDLTKVVEAARLKFSRAVKEYREVHGNYIDVAPTLPQQVLNGCMVYASRLEMLSSGLFKKNGVWAEIGVDQAIFSRHICDKISPRKLHLIDIDTNRIVKANIDEKIRLGVVEVHAGDSSSIISGFPDDHFDGIYVDGDHYYDGVRKDLLASVPKLVPGGYLVFNDYTSWSPGSMSKCGVAKAVNEFINERGWDVYAIALQGSGYYDIAIRKPHS